MIDDLISQINEFCKKNDYKKINNYKKCRNFLLD